MLDTVKAVLLEAGELIRAEAGRPGGPRGFGYKAPVDTEVETLIMTRLKAVFPDDEILAEETGGLPGTSGRAFVLDPHDGTRDFLRGRRETSISIALVEGGQMRMAAVYIPCASEVVGPDGLMVTWVEGGSLEVDGEPCSPPPCKGKLEADSVVLISANVRGRSLALNQSRLAPATIVGCASVATRFALVASGRADVAFTLLNPLEPWDYAGGQALVRAVGGELVGPDGAPVLWSGTRPTRLGLQGYFVARSEALAADVASRFSDLTGG